MTTDIALDQSLTALFQKIQEAGVNHCLVLTPNKRLSRFLHDQFNLFQANQSQLNTWVSLPCYSYHGWLQQQWERLATDGHHPLSDRVSLSSLQEAILWEQVINNHPDTPPLLAIQATLKLVQNAWRLNHEWALDLNECTDLNTRLFLAWSQQFTNLCSQQGFITAAEQAYPIIDAINQQLLQPPKQLFLYGFDEQPPQMLQLLDALAAQNTLINEVNLAPQESTVTRYEFLEENSEIEAAAIWAEQIIQQHQSATPPTVAIIVPNLAQNREKVERIFNRIFEPQTVLPESPQHAPGFNLSAAQPLKQTPLIHTALMALNCSQRYIDLEAASHLLRSPFIGSVDELEQRAIADTLLRGHEFEVTLKQLKSTTGKISQESGKKLCPDFYNRLDTFETANQGLIKSTLYPSEWINVFNQLLEALGWPGSRRLDTLEYQQLLSWQEALNEFAGLDYVTHKISLAAAIKYLNQVVAESNFKAQTKDSPVQILGMLEAAGLPFDAIWLMNLDDETWPPTPNPNPLIPIALQAEKQLPQSTPTRELIYAKRLTQRFTHSAAQIIFSHAKTKNDQALLASPLIAQIPSQAFNLTAPLSYADELFGQSTLEASWDNCGPHVTDSNRIRGGSQLLKDQAACPFRAFARHRLHSEEIPLVTIGLDPSERGNLLHTSLEIIWKKIRSQEKLLSLDEEALSNLINSAIDEAMLDIKSKRFVGERFIQIEIQRLHQQIHRWLTIEKQRAPFTVVMNEGKRTVKLGQLPIHIRYDRVDKLEDGSLFVLDYKTGNPSINQWNSERPDEPQVPLYCIANSGKVSGAAFGQINADNIAIKGAAEDETIAPGLAPANKLTVAENTDDWQQVITQWKTVLERLANEFMAGAAEVAPKNPPQTCTFCELAPLCRIKDQALEATDD